MRPRLSRVVVCHYNSLAKCFEGGLNLLGPRVMVRIQHPAYDRFPHQ
jgi:hypothetical protein